MRRNRNQDPEETEEELEFEPDGPGEDFEEDEYEEADADEYEEPDEDEYYDDDFYEEGEQEELEFPDEAGGEPPATKEPRQPLRLKAEAAWATVLAQARGVELPGKPEVNLKRVGSVAAIVLASFAVGIGAFLIGKGTGDDLDTARLEGEVEGRQAGAIEGAAEGYAAGFKKGRERGFRKAYRAGYRIYYKRAFEQAGLDVPRGKDIDVPAP